MDTRRGSNHNNKGKHSRYMDDNEDEKSEGHNNKRSRANNSNAGGNADRSINMELEKPTHDVAMHPVDLATKKKSSLSAAENSAPLNNSPTHNTSPKMSDDNNNNISEPSNNGNNDKISESLAVMDQGEESDSPAPPAPVANTSSDKDGNSPASSDNNLARMANRGKGYGPPLSNISEAVGNTPMVKISNRLCPEGRIIYAKCEYFNPLSSVKDRLALAIIEAAEKDGSLKPGQTVVEATSGNTGIAVAMMCAQRGYPCVIVMAEPFSVERRKLMRMLGAKVIVTPKAGKGTGMVEKAKELAEKHGWFLCHQFETDANWKFHYETTGPEICNDLKAIDTKMDYYVTGYGTGGTFHGAGKYIKENSPGTKIILAEPGAANLIGSGIKTDRNDDGSPLKSHPAFAAHPIQGWTPDFIPLVLEKGLGLQDEMIEIPDGAAVQTSQALARNEGILTGISGGATMWAAIETAKKAPEGSVIVAMLPDTGERYLSTPLFASIAADMNEEELEIARSTPSFILEPAALVPDSLNVHVHQLQTAPHNALKYRNHQWVKTASYRYQSFRCTTPSCKRRIRTFCSCEKGVWLCTPCHGDHLFNLGSGSN